MLFSSSPPRHPRPMERRPDKTLKNTWLLWVVSTACALIPVTPLCADEEPPSSSRTDAPGTSFRVALTGRYPPFSFFDTQGQLDGFDVDVSRAIAERLNRPLALITTEWDGILAGLLAGRYDAIIGSMAITPQREEVASFSDPYYYSGAQLFIHRDREGEIHGIEDDDLRIGVVVGETYEHFLREQQTHVRVVPYDDTQLIFQDLMHGRLDGFVSDRLVGAWQIRSANAPFVPAGDLLYEERIGIPVRQDQPELLAQINEALADLRETGELDRIFDQWFGLESVSEDEPAAPAEKMSFQYALRFLLKGFAVTLWIAALSLSFGFILSIPAGLVLNLPHGVIRLVVRGIVDFIRGTPVLIQLIFVYFGWPLIPVVGVSLSPIAASVLTLTINSAAYMAEVVRSGLMSVDPGQRLAGRALGLSPVQVFRWIVWPQAFRIAIPPLMNSVVALIKDTALISVVTVSELISNVRSVVSVTWNPAYYLLAAALFFAVTFPLMKLAGRLEARIRARGFEHD